MAPIHIICGLVEIILSLLGIIGNAISVYVLSKMNSKSLRLLKYLNVVDIVLLVITGSWLTLEFVEYDKGHIVSTLYNCIVPSFYIVRMFEVYLTVLIALLRCLAVATPYKFATYMRHSVQNKLLIAIAVFSVIFNVPLCLMSMGMSSYAIVEKMFKFQFSHLNLVFFCILPILVIILCNIILVVSRCKMKSFTNQDGQGRSPGRRNRQGGFQLTCLVLAITAMFIATHGPVGIANYIDYTTTGGLRNQIWIFEFGKLMITINSATNFIFYCLIGREFRTTLISLCKKRPRTTRRNQPRTATPV